MAQRWTLAIHALGESPKQQDVLLDLVGDARWVLIGEASHGTDEFHRQRAEEVPETYPAAL